MLFLAYDTQATLDEILAYFNGEGYNTYQLDADTSAEMLVIVDCNDDVFATFEVLDDKVYQVYELDYDVKFSEVAHLWGDRITKLA
jgi:hypothetical protein